MALTSEEWRLRGNDDFERAAKAKHNRFMAITLSPIEAYTSALSCYMHSMDLAKSDMDYSSAAKNYATTCIKMAESSPQWKRDERVDYLADAVGFISKAKYRGVGCQSKSWTNRISVLCKSTLETASNLADEFSGNEKAQVMQTLVKDLVDNDVKRSWLLRAVEILYNEATRTADENEARNLLYDALKPLERAKALGEETGHWEYRIDQARRDRDVKLEFKKAKNTLEDATKNPAFDAALLFWAIDTFVNTIKMCETSLHETEARAYNRLGYIYDTYLNNSDRAKAYHKQCIFIADNIHPKTYVSEDWYLQSVEAMKKFQKKAVEEADKSEYEEKKQYLEELKGDLAKLRAKSKEGVPALLAFIIKEFPPRSGSISAMDVCTLRSLDKDDLRKEVLKVVGRYHPDRQQACDKKWKILCEEITKELNKKLEILCEHC